MFSWANNRKSYPGQRTAAPNIQGSIRPPEYTRQQHLQSYLQDDTLQRSTRRISADDSTYDTVFQDVAGHTLILRVHLPPSSHPSAPVRPPTMTLAGIKARHSWLDSRMRVTGYPVIQSDSQWRDSRLLLGQAVHEVIKHLQLNPPDVVEFVDQALISIQSSSAASSSSSTTQFPQHPPQHKTSGTMHKTSASTDAAPDYMSLLSVPEIDMPTIPSHIDQLDKLSREELDELLTDELAFLAFCNKLPIMQTIQSISTSVITENAEMSQTNLEKETRLESLHSQVVQLHKKLKETVQDYQELEKRQNVVCAPPDQRKVLRELAKAKKESYDASEQMAEAWVKSHESSADQFVKEFVERRKEHHMRAAKMELLQKNKSIS